MAARATRSLTRTFVVLTALELAIQVGVLGLAIGGIISPELMLMAIVPVAVVIVIAAAITLSARAVGTVLIMRHASNLRQTGIQGMRLGPWSWLALWLPLLTWPALPVWLFATIESQSPFAWLASFVWIAVAVVALGGMALLHELWRATAPDQMDHWRYVPLSGVVVGWGVATVIDGLLPAINPFGLIASIVLARQLEARMADKLIVVEELRLLAARASATPSPPKHAESAS